MTETVLTGGSRDQLAKLTMLHDGPWAHASSLRFLLPVRHDEGTYAARSAKALSASLPGRDKPLWRPFDLVVDDLMPHVRRYLNTDGGDASTATLLSADTNELTWLAGGNDANWSLQLPRGRSLPFRISRAHLLLFRLDVSFLVLDLAPLTDDAADWFDLLHYARFFAGGRVRAVRVDRISTRSCRAAFALLSPDGAPVEDAKRTAVDLPGMRALLDVLLTSATLPDDHGTPQQMNTPGQFLAYPVLFLAGARRGTEQALLARVVGSHHARRTLSEDFSLDLGASALPYDEDSWLFVSTEGAGFLSLVEKEQDNDFARTALPAHVRNEYFLAYVLASFQRYALLRLSDEVAGGALTRDRGFAGTQRRILEFTGRGMFVQVTHSAHHHAWYAHVQRVQQVAELHQEVRDEVQAFQDYQRAEESERHERRSRAVEIGVAVITGVIVPLQLVTALFAEDVGDWPLLKHLSVDAQAYGTLAVVVLLSLLTYLGLRHVGRRQDRT